MPPPAQQTGSKAGLIAALVITVILLMVSVIMTITTNTDLVKKTKDLADQRKLYEKVVRTDQMLAEDTSDVALIDKEKDKFSELANPTTIDIALAEIKELNKVIDATTATSHAASTARAAEVVVRALAIVKDPSGNVPALAAPTSGPTATVVSMPDKESLFTAIDKLERRLVEITKNDAKKKADLDHLNKVLQDIKTNGDAQIAALATKADELVGKGKQAEDSKVMIQAGYIKKQEEISVENVKVVEESQKQIQDMQVRLAAATAEVARLKKALIPLQNRLALYRMDTKDSGVRVADGNIIRVVNGQTVYINLGTGDHLPAGTTFEVYDKIDGIPGLGSEPLGPNNMPKGKGSIEVVRVGQNSSECRIVHMQTGQTLSEGDILGNLVYNKDTQFHTSCTEILMSMVTAYGPHPKQKSSKVSAHAGVVSWMTRSASKQISSSSARNQLYRCSHRKN